VRERVGVLQRVLRYLREARHGLHSNRLHLIEEDFAGRLRLTSEFSPSMHLLYPSSYSVELVVFLDVKNSGGVPLAQREFSSKP